MNVLNPQLANALLATSQAVTGNTTNGALLYNKNLRTFWASQYLEGNADGFGISGGFKYDVSEKFSIGANFKWYAEQTIDGSSSGYILARDVSGDVAQSQVIQALLTNPGLDAATKQMIGGLYGMGADAKIPALKSGKLKDDAKAKLQLPMDFGFGMAYKFSETFMMSADFNLTKWKDLQKIDIELQTKGNGSSELLLDWKDVVRYSLGMKWDANQSMTLMSGMYYSETPTNDDTFDPSIPDLNNRFETSFGMNYRLGNGINAELAYAHIFFEDREIRDQNADENISATYSGSVNEFSVGLTYDF